MKVVVINCFAHVQHWNINVLSSFKTVSNTCKSKYDILEHYVPRQSFIPNFFITVSYFNSKHIMNIKKRKGFGCTIRYTCDHSFLTVIMPEIKQFLILSSTFPTIELSVLCFNLLVILLIFSEVLCCYCTSHVAKTTIFHNRHYMYPILNIVIDAVVQSDEIVLTI